jgi:hypothetical protein
LEKEEKKKVRAEVGREREEGEGREREEGGGRREKGEEKAFVCLLLINNSMHAMSPMEL